MSAGRGQPDPTVVAFARDHADVCAVRILTVGQHLRLQAGLALLLLFWFADAKVFAAALVFALAAFYAAVGAWKLLAVLLALAGRPEIRVHRADALGLPEAELPVYTVLLPMYREPAVAAKAIRAATSLEYPQEKLDILLLLEEDDAATRAACAAAELPACVRTLVVPPALPRTKPRACNHGLAAARGEFLVIFDAEDRPDCDQLRKAVWAFRRQPAEVACLQAKLNFYNAGQNWLTRWFTLEYTAWFDLFLPGLHRLGVPIPLGGTSNHFRTAPLRELGGWDPFNLTEDCDLGVRLHRRGLRTRVLDSTTWEEANARLGNWIRQRSRWVKGYLQTHLVHSRAPLRTLRELGPRGFLSFLLTVGGLPFSLLLNPLFWAVGAIYLGLCLAGLAGGPFPWDPSVGWRLRYSDPVSDLPGAPLTLWSQFSWIFWVVSIALAAANLLFVAVNVLACSRRRLWRLLPQALLSPIYWGLISIAAWKGFLQLFTRPFYWEKTEHGLSPHPPDACHRPDPSARIAPHRHA